MGASLTSTVHMLMHNIYQPLAQVSEVAKAMSKMVQSGSGGAAARTEGLLALIARQEETGSSVYGPGQAVPGRTTGAANRSAKHPFSDRRASRLDTARPAAGTGASTVGQWLQHGTPGHRVGDRGPLGGN